MSESDLPAPNLTEPELPSPLSVPELSAAPSAPPPVSIDDRPDNDSGRGFLVPLLVILVLIYFFGPLSWRSFLRTVKDNVLEEVKISASKLQSKRPEAPPLTLSPSSR